MLTCTLVFPAAVQGDSQCSSFHQPVTTLAFQFSQDTLLRQEFRSYFKQSSTSIYFQIKLNPKVSPHTKV